MRRPPDGRRQGMEPLARMAPPSLQPTRYRDHPPVAPIWKRKLAYLVDSLPYLAFLAMRLRHVLLKTNQRDPAMPDPALVAKLLAGVYEVAARTMFGRTVGQRVWNLRVISQETGRSPTLKQSFVMWAVREVPILVLDLWPNPPQLDAATKAEIEQKHRGDREARNRALACAYKAFYEDRNFNPVRHMLHILLRMALSLAYTRMMGVSVRRDPLNQGVAGRRAKILVVDECPSSFPRLARLFSRPGRVPSAGRLIHLVPLRKWRAA